MAIQIKELNISDSEQLKLEKTNFNFDQLILAGGGPPGPIGPIGTQGVPGPVGKRGEIWISDIGSGTAGATSGPNNINLIAGDNFLNSDGRVFEYYDDGFGATGWTATNVNLIGATGIGITGGSTQWQWFKGVTGNAFSSSLETYGPDYTNPINDVEGYTGLGWMAPIAGGSHSLYIGDTSVWYNEIKNMNIGSADVDNTSKVVIIQNNLNSIGTNGLSIGARGFDDANTISLDPLTDASKFTHLSFILDNASQQKIFQLKNYGASIKIEAGDLSPGFSDDRFISLSSSTFKISDYTSQKYNVEYFANYLKVDSLNNGIVNLQSNSSNNGSVVIGYTGTNGTVTSINDKLRIIKITDNWTTPSESHIKLSSDNSTNDGIIFKYVKSDITGTTASNGLLTKMVKSLGIAGNLTIVNPDRIYITNDSPSDSYYRNLDETTRVVVDGNIQTKGSFIANQFEFYRNGVGLSSKDNFFLRLNGASGGQYTGLRVSEVAQTSTPQLGSTAMSLAISLPKDTFGGSVRYNDAMTFAKNGTILSNSIRDISGPGKYGPFKSWIVSDFTDKGVIQTPYIFNPTNKVILGNDIGDVKTPDGWLNLNTTGGGCWWNTNNMDFTDNDAGPVGSGKPIYSQFGPPADAYSSRVPFDILNLSYTEAARALTYEKGNIKIKKIGTTVHTKMAIQMKIAWAGDTAGNANAVTCFMGFGFNIIDVLNDNGIPVNWFWDSPNNLLPWSTMYQPSFFGYAQFSATPNVNEWSRGIVPIVANRLAPGGSVIYVVPVKQTTNFTYPCFAVLNTSLGITDATLNTPPPGGPGLFNLIDAGVPRAGSGGFFYMNLILEGTFETLAK